VPVYVPLARHSKDMGRIALTDMIGRDYERFALAEALRALITKESRVVIIEGEAGLGKSRLVEELLRQAEAMNVETFLGIAEAIEQNTPYYVWKNIAAKIFHLDDSASVSEQRAHFERSIEADQFTKERAPLLSAVLPFTIADNEHTRNILGEARARAMHRLLIERFARAAQESPTALVIEDVHTLDSGSWALLLFAAQRVSPLLIVLTMRPMEKVPPPELTQLQGMDSARRLTLAPLSHSDTETLICQRLNVHTLPSELVSFIGGKAEGHPFYSEELAYALRDGGYIETRDRECRITSFAGNLEDLNLPGSLEGVITSRIDRMQPPHQLTLKVASVIGRAFALQELSAIYPIQSERNALPEYLSQLEKQELTILDTPEPDISYLFKHIITQEVAYNLLLFAQRRTLHRAIAEWYERHHARELAAFYPALAHHWKQAEVPQKAVEYLEKAGEMAFRNGAYREAIQFFTQALEKSEKMEGSAAPLKVATWLRTIGEAQMGLGQMETARATFRRAAQVLNRPAAVKPLSIVLELASQLIIQSLHRRFPNFFLGRMKEKDAELQEAAHNFTHLAHVNYMKLESIPMVYHVVKGLNLSEAGGGMSPARVWALGTASAIMGFLPNHALAERYAGMALSASSQVDSVRAQIWTHLAVGTYKTGAAQWDKARASLQIVKELAGRASDLHHEGDAETVLAGLEYYRGVDFEACQGHYDDLTAQTKKSGNLLQSTWAIYGNAFLQLVRGEFELALDHVKNGESLDDTPINIAHLNCIRALANWRTGRLEQALRNCACALSILLPLPPQVYSLLMGYRTVAQVACEAWEKGISIDLPGWRTRSELNRTLASILRALSKYRRTFPIGEPSLLYHRGCRRWINRNHEAAIRDWQASARAARGLGMPWDEALALREIGNRSGGAIRRANLGNALALFEASHAIYDAMVTKRMLEEGPRPPGSTLPDLEPPP
jgi:tetratricopeptide (TPR) repeat protein